MLQRFLHLESLHPHILLISLLNRKLCVCNTHNSSLFSGEAGRAELDEIFRKVDANSDMKLNTHERRALRETLENKKVNQPNTQGFLMLFL